MLFYHFKNVKAQKGQRCTAELFDKTISDPKLATLCQQIADETDKQRRQELKKQLPIATFHASFGDKRRTNANAIPSGLCAVDLDDLEYPYQTFWEKVWPSKGDLDIRLAYMTPSQHGLRVVFVRNPQCPTIEENIKWFEQLTGLECDPACKDLARASYLVPESYIYYRDNSMFEEVKGEEVKGERLEGERLEGDEGKGEEVIGERSEGERCLTAPASDLSTLQTEFKGLKLTDIADEWMKQNGGLPVEGERNSKLHRLAFSMRYITDFRPEPIFHAIPHCGLSDTEVMSICHSACIAPRSNQMPHDFQRLLARMMKNPDDSSSEAEKVKLDGTSADLDPHDENFLKRLPQHLPIGLADSLCGVPEKTKMPIICAVMTIGATYATNVEVEYCDGMRGRLNLMTIIYGPQASGKSSVKQVMDVWMKPMIQADALAHKVEEEYKQLKKSRKANEKLPDEPSMPIINIPVTVSNTVLLKRMLNAKGRHLFSFGEELDTMNKTNKAGAWSNKYDVYRVAFDNGMWGQDYNSDNSVSGQVGVAYNWCMLGTPLSVRRIFKSDSIENGMSGRMLFSMMPSNYFEFLPRYKPRDPKCDENILEAVHILSNCSGFIDTPRLRAGIKKWSDEKTVEAAINKDFALDVYRRRAALIGFRCGVVYHLLQTKGDLMGKESRDCVNFAVMMADYALKYQLGLFRDAMKESIEIAAVATGLRVTKRLSMFDQLPDEFTTADIRQLDPEISMGAVRQTVYVWNQQNLLVSKGRGRWRKKTCGEQEDNLKLNMLNQKLIKNG